MGSRCASARDWKRRRQEILELFATNVYGHSPKAPKHRDFDVFDIDKTALGGKAIRKQVTIYFSAKKDGPREDVLIYIPAGAHKPVPMILTLNFSGNQSVINDPGIKLPTIWDWKTHVKQQASEESRGHDTRIRGGENPGPRIRVRDHLLSEYRTGFQRRLCRRHPPDVL